MTNPFLDFDTERAQEVYLYRECIVLEAVELLNICASTPLDLNADRHYLQDDFGMDAWRLAILAARAAGWWFDDNPKQYLEAEALLRTGWRPNYGDD